MLAYVFWHRPCDGVAPSAYEAAQRSFHEAIETSSACFRLDELPFADRPGYEDWYLLDDWGDLGRLNDAAIDAVRRGDHDRAASLAAAGWGAVYASERGPGEIPAGTSWHDKPPGTPAPEFVESLGGEAAWRRQLVLGPAPEFCIATSDSAGRRAVSPL